jgi:cytochrome bd ubiquinol oxidase subunit I
MEFQFGTNWARFSHFAGPVVGQTLFMEGVFAFFAESSFLGLFLFGERRVSRWAALAVRGDGGARGRALGLLHRRHECLDAAPGRLRDRRRARELTSLWGLLTNPVRALAVPARDQPAR